MDKDIRKNREALIRYFYSLPKGGNTNKWNNYSIEGEKACLCAKGQTMKLFFGMVVHENSCSEFYRTHNIVNLLPEDNNSWGSLPEELDQLLDITAPQWREMERIYEGRMDYSKRHSFSQTADWLQTLPGWPRVL